MKQLHAQHNNSYDNAPVLSIVASLLLLLFVAIGMHVNGGHVSAAEAELFKEINGMPSWLLAPMTIFQYAGLLYAPVAAAIVLVACKKYVPAMLVLLVIPAKLHIESIVKSNFMRERPKVYIAEAILRGDVQASGLSFASGHAMIVFALATFTTPFLPKIGKWIVWVLAALCLVARVYLGAHLPLDVIGGAILGVALGLLLYVVWVLLTVLYSRTRHKNS